MTALSDGRTWSAPLRRDLRRVAAAWRALGRWTLAAAAWVRATRTELLELGFVLLALAGVALMHLPTAMILGGVLGVVAVERRSTAGRQRSTAPEPRSERVA